MEDHSLNGYLLVEHGGFLVASMVRNLPVMRADQPANPGLIKAQEDPMEKGMATHSSILAWRIPWTKEPGGLLQSWMLLSDYHFHFGLSMLFTGES